MLLQKCLEIVNDLYVEPTNEELIGSFLILNVRSGRPIRINSKQSGPSKKEDLLMLSQNHDRGLTLERYFSGLKYVKWKLNDSRVKTAVLLL